MRKYLMFLSLAGASVLAGCDTSPEEGASAPAPDAPGESRAVALPDDFPGDILLPEDTRLVLVSHPLPGDTFLEGRSSESAEAIVEGFAKRLVDAGYVLMDRDKITDPLELYFEGKGIETGNLRVRDDGADRDFMLTFTAASQ